MKRQYKDYPKRWLLGTFLQKMGYLVIISVGFFLDMPLIFQFSVLVILIIVFFFEVKQDYNNLQKILK